MSTDELARMRDRKFSSETFLGQHESLQEIVADDERVLLQNDISWKEFANAIFGLFNFFRKQEQFVRTLLGSHRVTCSTLQLNDTTVLQWSFDGFRAYLGYQECPFDKCVGSWAKFGNENVGSMELQLSKTAENVTSQIHISDLLCHLCDHHHFLEGKNCAMRIDPQNFIDFFSLQSEKKECGSISAHWLEEKIDREKIKVERVIDLMPEHFKMMDGIGGLRYST